MSYLGAMQWLVASRQPPHLAAIVPWEAFSDQLRDLAYHGGIPSDFFSGWYASQVKSIQNGLGAAGYRNAFNGRLISGDDTVAADVLAEHHEPTDIYRQAMQHPLDGEFWQGRQAQWENVTVPLLSVGSWGAVGVHARGNVEGFMRAASTDKWLVMRRTNGSFSNLYDADGIDLQRRFLDYHLRGEGDWPDRQPRVSVEVRDVHGGTAHVRTAEAWPIPRTRWTDLHLDVASAGLGPDVAGNSSAAYSAADGSLRLTTRPLDRDTEVIGPLACKLWISSSTADADLFLTVHVLDDQGAERFFSGICDPMMPLTAGWLRASQRALDDSRSLPYRPFLSHRTMRPLVPGDLYEVDIELWPTSVLIPAGFRLGLTISGRDYDHGNPVPWSKGGRTVSGSSIWTHRDERYRPRDVYAGDVTVHSGPDTPSRLLVPAIPKD